MTELFTHIDAVLLPDEPMANHTTFRIGGYTPLLIIPRSEQGIRDAIRVCKDNSLDIFILGNGSNLLISDKGINKVVIKISNSYAKSYYKDGVFTADAGLKLSKCCVDAATYNLAGLEFAYGIPGTVGGAVFMNAGAYGGEMKNVIRSVTFLSTEGTVLTKSADELKFSYRFSEFMELDTVVLSAEFALKPGEEKEITHRMEELLAKRQEKQPLEYPSAGSIFKRPQEGYAAELIDRCGLRGFRLGDAQVSEKHTGFIVNRGTASCDDVLKLIEHIKSTVFDKTGVKLETEVKNIGE